MNAGTCQVGYGWYGVVLGLGLLVLANPVFAQGYKAGEVIEYKVRGAAKETWERGTIIRLLDGGKQYLIHEKPSEFFPEGPEKAYALSEMRRPQTAKPLTGAKSDSAKPAVDPSRPLVTSDKRNRGLLSQADVVAYAKEVFGPGDPFADSQRRETNLERIRDHIKERGTSFLWDLKFDNELRAIGASSVHINSAIEANHGRTPRLKDYYGTYLLRTTNRGTRQATSDGTRIVITTTDAQFEAGALSINADGTFVWKLGRNDPRDEWVTGKWREVEADEQQPWEGGPALWLIKARQGEDYMVRKCRVPDYEGWIDIGMTKGRIAASYGRPE